MFPSFYINKYYSETFIKCLRSYQFANVLNLLLDNAGI
jgi:hypothetical protein